MVMKGEPDMGPLITILMVVAVLIVVQAIAGPIATIIACAFAIILFRRNLYYLIAILTRELRLFKEEVERARVPPPRRRVTPAAVGRRVKARPTRARTPIKGLPGVMPVISSVDEMVYDYVVRSGGVISISKAAGELGITAEELKASIGRLKRAGRLKA